MQENFLVKTQPPILTYVSASLTCGTEIIPLKRMLEDPGGLQKHFLTSEVVLKGMVPFCRPCHQTSSSPLSTVIKRTFQNRHLLGKCLSTIKHEVLIHSSISILTPSTWGTPSPADSPQSPFSHPPHGERSLTRRPPLTHYTLHVENALTLLIGPQETCPCVASLSGFPVGSH